MPCIEFLRELLPTRSNHSLHNATVGENDFGDKECIWLMGLRILIEESLTWMANESDFGANGSSGDDLSMTWELTSLTSELMSLTRELMAVSVLSLTSELMRV